MDRAGPPRRILLGAFGDPGHAFPMIALGRALAARGHDVTLQTWARWREHVQAQGMRFAAAPEYQVFPNGPEPLDFYVAVVHATRDTLALLEQSAPEVVVADILTLAPALAAEIHGVAFATLIPHVYPDAEPHFPVYSLGARLPRTAFGRLMWRASQRAVAVGLERGRVQLNDTRARLGLAPLPYFHGGISRRLALVATLPALEYPRAWPEHVHVVGPLMWEPPAAELQAYPSPGSTSVGAVAAPGSAPELPLVLVAPSTAQDPGHHLLHSALEGLAELPVRVLGTWNGRLPSAPLRVPANARVLPWVTYSRTMPLCAAVVCHAGHGTLVRALTSGAPVLACPAAGDMNENSARLDWAGAGLRLPRRFVSPRSIAAAVQRILDDPAIARRAQEIARWAAAHDAGTAASLLVENLAACGAPHAGARSGPVTG
jgi:UDP:flavonoid glycosyltransferase YjiC (YdhE family)